LKVLVIGSGPIVIGQAAEFDYAGTQACKSLREEGCEVVLVNSNPATIMTDQDMSDALYIEPLNVDFLERVIARERPDALLPTLGGQTGLNLATQLAHEGILDQYNVKLLGTPLEAIQKAEDRESFRALMREIKEPVPESWIIESPDELKAILDIVPYPCIVRPAYTLGGTGGGIADTREELWEIGQKGLKLSMRSQLMIERSLLGWKEIEYEVMRDSAGNCITVCNMENLDPMGVHTGDSIVVAPSQTLSDIEYHMLRTASLKIIRALGIEGGCNVQLAVNPESFDYYIIEVNPRVSRSSALASKATGYPIARVAAKIAVGRTLDEIDNQVTGSTKACFEPALDYCVVKVPRWPFDKFAYGDRSLFTQMKATGEVMAIDRTFESALMKALRGLEVKQKDLRHPKFQGTGNGASILPVDSSDTSSESSLHIPQGHPLPRWTADGAIYAVTFRLADSLPKEILREFQEERTSLQKLAEAGSITASAAANELTKIRLEKVEKTLDAGAGSCLLRMDEPRRIVAEALQFFDGERYELYAACVMPNHVHVLLKPLGEHQLPGILDSWKSFTATAINKELDRSGTLWQEEYYDHLVRPGDDFKNQFNYIAENPQNSPAAKLAWLYLADVDGTELHGQDAHSTEIHGEDGHATSPDRMSDSDLRNAIHKPTDERLWALAEALRRGWTVQEINKICRVDIWFLVKIKKLVDMELRLSEAKRTQGKSEDTAKLIREAFILGFPSPTILSILGIDGEHIERVGRFLSARRILESNGKSSKKAARKRPKRLAAPKQLLAVPTDSVGDKSLPETIEHLDQQIFALADSDYAFLAALEVERQKVMPVFKMVDTCAGEFESKTPYYYGTYEQEDDAKIDAGDKRETVLVLGSGPIRIGQGIEFDYSCVHCVWALERLGYRAIIVNNNPETVSTDFDTGDGLYFEPVTLEDVLDIASHEKPIGAVVQFGGQTAINLATKLNNAGLKVLGTNPDAIDCAEDRDRFEKLLNELEIPKPAGRAVRSLEEAVVVASEIGYPVLVRPSFVLGGRAMEIVYSEAHLRGFYCEAEDANPGQPVLIDRYVLGPEAEVDVISDGEETLVPGIMEHIERAGVHSGDSMAVYPAVNLTQSVQRQMVTSACKIARALGIKGLMNIQFVIQNDIAYVLEVNPRASRTVPYLSKVTGIPMVDLATRCMMGAKLRDLGLESGLWVLGNKAGDAEGGTRNESQNESFSPKADGYILPEADFMSGKVIIPSAKIYAVKAPVFSFQKLTKVEPSLGPEMKSTGEILGTDFTFEAALYKALVASGITFKGGGYVLLTVQDADKGDAVKIAGELHKQGFKIAATGGTHDALQQAGIPSHWVMKIHEGSPNLLDMLLKGEVSLMINTPGPDKDAEIDGAKIRRACIETGVACVTAIDTAFALIRALKVFSDPDQASCLRLEEYLDGAKS
jgi:carbamoyl-phosphate synthase large subunit